MDRFEDAVVVLLPRLRRLARALTETSAEAEALVSAVIQRTVADGDDPRTGDGLDGYTLRIMNELWTGRPRPRPAADRPDGAARPVAHALEQLPDDQRIAIALVLVEGLSYAEAAEVLEISTGALSGRLARGRSALMGLLEA